MTVFYWAVAVMHYDFYQLHWHYAVNQPDLNMVHHCEIMNHATLRYFVYCDNIHPLDVMIALNFLGHLLNQLDPNMNHAQYRLNRNGFVYAM